MDASGGLSLKPVATVRASEAIYEQIKEKILVGELRPGDRLPSERQLMDMLARSRPTIREALRMLERDGFIRTAPGTHGAIIQKFGTANVEQPLETMLQVSDITIGELYEFRMQCECAIAGWAAQRRDEADVARLQEIVDECGALFGERDYAQFMQMDVRFHECLARAAKNEVACIFSGVFHKITERFLTPALEKKTASALKKSCQSMLEGHEAIFGAVRAGDEALAREAMAKHLDAFSSEFERT